MLKGKLKFFDDSKGYGIIEQEDGSDVVLHYSANQGLGLQNGLGLNGLGLQHGLGLNGLGLAKLTEGDAVAFDVHETPHGLHAINVIKA